MDHGPVTKWKVEKSQRFKARLGLIMFAIYTPIYFAFIVLAVTNPQVMARDVGNLNVAITYGFGLIVMAIIQALIYNYICSNREKMDVVSTKDKGEID